MAAEDDAAEDDAAEDDDADEDDASTELPEPSASSSAETSVRLVPSLWAGRPATLFFEYPKELGLSRPGPSLHEPLGTRKLGFKCAWERNCVKNAFVLAGFGREREDKRGGTAGPWSAAWMKHLQPEQFAALARNQKVNTASHAHPHNHVAPRLLA